MASSEALPQRADNVLLQTFRTGHAVRELMEHAAKVRQPQVSERAPEHGRTATDVDGLGSPIGHGVDQRAMARSTASCSSGDSATDERPRSRSLT